MAAAVWSVKEKQAVSSQYTVDTPEVEEAYPASLNWTGETNTQILLEGGNHPHAKNSTP